MQKEYLRLLLDDALHQASDLRSQVIDYHTEFDDFCFAGAAGAGLPFNSKFRISDILHGALNAVAKREFIIGSGASTNLISRGSITEKEWKSRVESETRKARKVR